ncbi:hypothetical protein Fmac_028344 [Flemingia macrophylla]|uniref:Uncharacterized protein n=1 Tax=Flemingia macrophylla TaxID=520843 RepID=A0ABD1L783_9FABA
MKTTKDWHQGMGNVQILPGCAQSDYGSYNVTEPPIDAPRDPLVIGFAKAKGPAVPVALQKPVSENGSFFVSRHSAVPQGVLDIIQSMPHDAHPMGVLVNSMSAVFIFHPDANPALRVSNKNCWQVYLVAASHYNRHEDRRTIESILHLAGLKNVKSKTPVYARYFNKAQNSFISRMVFNPEAS